MNVAGVLPSLSWAHVNAVTSGAACSATVAAALIAAAIRQLWVAGRGGTPIALTAVTVVLVVVAVAIVGTRLLALAQ